MIRFDIEICNCEDGPHLEYNYHPEGSFVRAEEVEKEIANGRITPDSIGTADEHYNAFGRAR
jgi:hypothetical protein